MKIEIWSDFSCPYCYIGLSRFKKALEIFPHASGVEVIHRSYELNPELEPEGNPPLEIMLMHRYAIPKEQAKETLESVAAMAEGDALPLDLSKVVSTNTRDAHRLKLWAGEQNPKTLECLMDRIYQAHFTEGKNIGLHEVLGDLAADCGLDRTAAMDFLSTDRFGDDVALEQLQGNNIGLQGVPFFLVENRYQLAGAIPSLFILQFLAESWEAIHPPGEPTNP